MKETEPVRETPERARLVVDFSSAIMEPMAVLITKSTHQNRKDAEDAKRSLKAFLVFLLRPLRPGGEFCEALTIFTACRRQNNAEEVKQ